MKKGDALSLGPDAWRLVDELNAVRLAAGERAVEIVDSETNVMDAGAALPEELPDGGIGFVWFQQFDQRFSGGESHDARAIGVIERGFGEAEDIAIEGNDRREGFHGDAEVGDAGAALGWRSHGKWRSGEGAKQGSGSAPVMRTERR